MRKRDQERAAQALHNAREDFLRQRIGRTASDRCNQKNSDCPHEEALAAKAQAQPPRGGDRERGGDDIGGDDPRNLVLGRRERALHVRQCHRGDSPVHRIQEARQPDGGGDQGCMS